MRTRVTELLGIEIPVFQAPMGYIARASLASAVSEAGGAGIVETGSGDFAILAEECARMRAATSRPWGLNAPIRFVLKNRDALMALIRESGAAFVTTSAGDPSLLVPDLKAAGLIVFHVVPSLKGALKAVAAGADGLVVEGVEGGGFKDPHGASTMVLLPLVASRVDLPIVAAGGICEGVSMAAALTLGAEGVQMGTRMFSAAESPAHPRLKQLIVDAAETDTLLVRREGFPWSRSLRTPLAEAVAAGQHRGPNPLSLAKRLYAEGDLEASLLTGGQVVGRIDAVRPVADILREMWADCIARLEEMGAQARAGGAP